MPPPQLGVRRSGAELGFLDPAAGDADEMVVVVGPAADIGGSAGAGEGAHAAVEYVELDSVFRCAAVISTAVKRWMQF